MSDSPEAAGTPSARALILEILLHSLPTSVSGLFKLSSSIWNLQLAPQSEPSECHVFLQNLLKVQCQ